MTRRPHRTGRTERPDPPAPTPRELREVAQMRRISRVLVITALLWLAAQWLGPQLGLAGEYAFLIDLAAMAAFIWSLVVGVQLWRGRDGGNG